MKELSKTMRDGVSLEVIATFQNGTQDIFRIDFYTNKIRKHLKSENDLLNYIQDCVNYRKENVSNIPKDILLIKLSLCFFCNIESVKKYPTIQKVISKNGKYYFEENCRLFNSVVKELSIEQINEMLKESDWDNYQLQRFDANKVKRTIH